MSESLRGQLHDEGMIICGKDGETHRLREIRASDADSLMRGFASMSAEARRFRTFSALPRLTPEMAARFCSPDPDTEFCAVIEGRGALAGEILGGARVAGLGPDEDAEFAVSLRPEAAGLGLARQALSTVIEVAREAGCRSIFGLIAARNKPMIGLAKRLGFEIRRSLSDASLVKASLMLRPAPSSE